MAIGWPAWSGTISSGGGAWRCCAARGTEGGVGGASPPPRQSRDGVMIPSSPGSVAGRRVRRALGAVAITAGLFLFELAAVPFFVDLDRYRDRWLPAVESALGRRVEVGRVELTVLTGLGARLDGLAVHGDPADPEPLLAVESVRLRVRLLPLIRGRVVVARVVLTRPALRFVARAADGPPAAGV